MEFQARNFQDVLRVTFVVLLVSCFTAGEVEESEWISPDDPVIEDILKLWELWITGHQRPRPQLTPHLPPHLNFIGEKGDCDISPEEQLSVEYIRRFINIKKDLPSSKYDKENPEKILGNYFLFFLQQTRFLIDFSKNTRTACLDENRENPVVLVCLPSKKKCRPCDFHMNLTPEDEDTIRKICNIQTSPPFKYDPEIKVETLSHRKLPNWTEIMRMTPQNFTQLESQGPGDLPPTHYAFEFIFRKWEKMMEQVSTDNKSCSVTFDDQFQLATGTVLMGMEDRKEFGARNLFYLLRNLRDFHEKGKTFCRSPNVVCSHKKECVKCEDVEGKVKLKKASFEAVEEEEKVLMTLCRSQVDPRSEKRIPWKGVDEEILSPTEPPNKRRSSSGNQLEVFGGTSWRLLLSIASLLLLLLR